LFFFNLILDVIQGGSDTNCLLGWVPCICLLRFTENEKIFSVEIGWIGWISLTLESAMVTVFPPA
jgi:hypothetical protein